MRSVRVLVRCGLPGILPLACVTVTPVEQDTLYDEGWSEAPPVASSSSGDGSPGSATESSESTGTERDAEASTGASSEDGTPQRIPNLDCSENLIVDPGFERGSPSTAWVESAEVFGTVVCSSACAPGEEGAAPHGGSWWAWFGGHDAAEVASLQQVVSVDGTRATLGFFLAVNRAGGEGDATFEVWIDDTQLFFIDDAAAAVGDYERIEVDVTPFSDGQAHTLAFRATFTGAGVTNFFLDDVVLQGCSPPASGVTEGNGTDDATETGATSNGSESDGATTDEVSSTG